MPHRGLFHGAHKVHGFGMHNLSPDKLPDNILHFMPLPQCNDPASPNNDSGTSNMTAQYHQVWERSPILPRLVLPGNSRKMAMPGCTTPRKTKSSIWPSKAPVAWMQLSSAFSVHNSMQICSVSLHLPQPIRSREVAKLTTIDPQRQCLGDEDRILATLCYFRNLSQSARGQGGVDLVCAQFEFLDAMAPSNKVNPIDLDHSTTHHQTRRVLKLLSSRNLHPDERPVSSHYLEDTGDIGELGGGVSIQVGFVAQAEMPQITSIGTREKVNQRNVQHR
ncbi:hypothetical protein B0H14DRAFT_2577783 [Mycena olivaceomarginata]|nr:hypothetical protein B0H14DRAFT_2577783 [Mycena olivaceomarginata]